MTITLQERPVSMLAVERHAKPCIPQPASPQRHALRNAGIYLANAATLHSTSIVGFGTMHPDSSVLLGTKPSLPY